MISRVAEHCYWLARYLERAENTARMLEVNHTLLLDFHVPTDQQWKPLLIISGIHDYKQEPSAENVQDFMTWEPANPVSIVSSLAAARENARIIREVVSAEMWERINYYHLWIQSPAARAAYGSSRTDFYAQIRRINQLLYGIGSGTMAHGEPWEFIRLGGNLERASQTARVLDVKYHTILPNVEQVGTPIDNAHWVAILMSCSGYEPFHKRPRLVPVDPGPAVAEFLLFDEPFPRSVRHCVDQCHRAVLAIAGDEGAVTPELRRAFDPFCEWLRSQSIQNVIKEGLHESLTYCVNSTHKLGDAIAKSYFDVSVKRLPAPKGAKPAPAMTQSQGQA